MKKTLIITAVLILAFLIFCFAIGYKLPQSDKHKEWTTLESNTDKSYFIEKSIGAGVLISMRNVNCIVAVGVYSKNFIDSTGHVLYTVPQAVDVLVDSLHNRIMISKYTSGKDSGTYEYSIYDPVTTKVKPVNPTVYILKETYKEFLERKKITHEYTVSGQKEYYHQDSLYKIQYKAEHAKVAQFFSTLYPIVKVEADSDPLKTRFYTDKSGKIYQIKNHEDEDSMSYNYFMSSMDLLYPRWLEVPDIVNNNYKSPNFYVADNSIVTGNDFDFDSGISFMSPTGGSSRNMSMRFDQTYLNYYKIKLKDSTINFKMHDNVHIIYVEKNINDFRQLNIPKSDRDTLAFFFDGQMYRVYPRKK